MRILLVKTSSLGDIVHNLPVATDLRQQFPDAQIDWLVEENFVDIPRLHPAIREVLPVAIRRWRKHPFAASTWREIKSLRARLRQPYDIVLDTQGLVKSAVLAHWANGVRHGYTADSIHEPLATFAYDVKHKVDKAKHAVACCRSLAAAAFGYTLPSTLDYGISAAPLTAPWLPASPYTVLLTATSQDEKLWPEAHWVALGHALKAQGIHCVLPAGTAIEQARAARIAAAIGGTVPPPLTLAALAQLMAGASVVVGVDTGLTHLAAALGRPVVALYCATDPTLTGVLAPQPVFNLGGIGTLPTSEEAIEACRSLAC